MTTVQQMRASDLDREQVVGRLRGAFEQGRLTLDEYLARMETACQARTYGELVALCADLPAAGDRAPAGTGPAGAGAAGTGPAGTGPAGAGAGEATTCAFALLPGAVRVLWTIWLAIVSVNVVVWATVSLTGPRWVYPWPLWVAGPWGAVLLATSAGLIACRRATR